MNFPISFKGCKTRAEVMARYEAFLDEQLAETRRSVAARFMVDDGLAPDVSTLDEDLLQLDAMLMESRAESVTAFAGMLDQLFVVGNES